MKVLQLNELIGSVIPEITLTVDAVYPPKTGTGKKGAWHCQNLGCSDETGKIRVSVWNHSELDQSIKGTQIKLKSIAGKRGLSGVVCEMNEYIDKKGEEHKDLQLKVNDNGIIITQAGSVGSKPLDAGYDKKQTVESDKDVHEPMFKKKMEEHFPSIAPGLPLPAKTDPIAKIRQYGELYKACYDEAETIEKIGFKAEDTRNIASCFFIQGIKDGLHLQMSVKLQPDDKSNPENDDIPF